MILDFPLTEISTLLKQGAFSLADLIHEAYENIAKYEPEFHAFTSIRPQKDVLLEAERLSTSKPKGLLYGVPYVLKDSYASVGMPTTAGSSVLKNYQSPFNATVQKKLAAAGAILIGKTTMDAWGHGGTTENTDFPPTKNPYNSSHVVGGSSGGSAAAIALRFASFAIGEDTGGSIRNPAAWTNTTGLKVSYGRVSRYGCIAYASSFDTVGPMAKTAADCAVVLSAIAGVDPLDATSSRQPVPQYHEAIHHALDDVVIGIPRELSGNGITKPIQQALQRAALQFETIGAKVIPVDMPLLTEGISMYYLIGLSETSSNLARYDGVRYGQGREFFTQETIRRIILGTYTLSAGYYDRYYRQAQKARTALIKEYETVFKKVNMLLMPVNPFMPPRAGDLLKDPLANMLADMCTVTQNIVGVPSLALPAGFNAGLPIGIQLTGPMFSEGALLSLGHQYQQQTTWHLQQPKVQS